MNPYLLIFLLVLGLGMMATGGYFLLRSFQMRRGTIYHNRVGRYLRRWCAVRRYRLLENVVTTCKGQRLKTDFIVVGIFGVLLVNVFPKDADLYGNDGDAAWMVKKSQTDRRTIPNPIDQCDRVIASLREAFAGQKVYKIPMEQFYIYPCRRFKCFVADRYPVYLFSKFKALLTRDKYHEEKDIDMEQLEALIRQA